MPEEKTSDKIINIIKQKGRISANELSKILEISPRAVFKQLARLLTMDKVEKIGRPPKVFYLLKKNLVTAPIFSLNEDTKNIITEKYLIITPTGERLGGIDGFVYWCNKNNLPIEKTAHEYILTLKKYEKFRKNNLIDGMVKIKSTFKNIALSHLFYLDFYSIERFGKTKLGQLLLYAKQSQDRKLMKELIIQIKIQVDNIIKKYRVDGIGFIPPTVKREVQFMKALEQNLHPQVRVIKISKAKTDIIVPQKTLNKLEDRIDNAKKTIIVEDRSQYDNVLLIDDAVGSGATLNETAMQIKQSGLVKGRIIGLAITGSFKGFDVISEV